jgi:hypothetical protein
MCIVWNANFDFRKGNVMKTIIGVLACVLSVMIPTAAAVTVDLASPQEGLTLAPGDAIELELTVGNDSEGLELVVSVMDVEVGDGVPGDGIPDPAPGNIPGISHKPIRIKLGPGESTTKVFELVLPRYKQLPAGEYAFTISVTAKGLISQTEAADTLAFLMVK